jgi:RHS repeat-associated protein
MKSSNTNGVDITYGYDAQSRLSTVTDNGLHNTTNYTYNTVGSLESCTYPNNVKHTWTYDSRNRLTNLTISNITSGTMLKSFAYTLGQTGNRTRVVEDSNRTVDWTYDDLYRLTNEAITNDPHSTNGAVNYSYDAVGNRQTRASTLTGVSNQDFSSTYDTNDRLNASGYGYDNAGSTTQGPDGRTYTYDAEGHLLTVTNGSDTITYTYDGDGTRTIKRKDSGGNISITRYLTDSNNPTGYVQVLEEINGGYQVQKHYIYGLDLISQTDTVGTAGTQYYGYDGIGSTRILTDSTGNISDQYDYDAFGTQVYRSGTTDNSYLFQGEQYDADLGQYYLRARYMNADIGRFWGMDSYEGDINNSKSLHSGLNPSDWTPELEQISLLL